MGPGNDELDDEIRGHLAISIKQRIERGEDPESARLAALREFGNVTLTRDAVRSVWRPLWIESAAALGFIAAMSSSVILSFRETRKSICASISPSRCTRL